MKMQKMLAAAAGLMMCFGASATDYTLTNNNARVTFSPEYGFGMKDWHTDGVDHLFRQQFFYRVGSTGFERNINSLDVWEICNTGPNSLNVVYGSSKLKIEVSYLLTGGAHGSGASMINEEIKITNLSDKSINLHFFQFVDFDLGESHVNDQLYLVQNLEGLFTGAYQNKGSSYFAEEVVSPGANRAQADEVYPTWPLIDSLQDGQPTTLNNNAGPVSGDVAWAFQWDKSLAAGACFEVSILKSVYTTPVPEPSVLGIVSLLGVAVMVRKRLKA